MRRKVKVPVLKKGGAEVSIEREGTPAGGHFLLSSQEVHFVGRVVSIRRRINRIRKGGVLKIFNAKRQKGGISISMLRRGGLDIITVTAPNLI